MTEKEYVESFGLRMEDLSASELKAVRAEVRDINAGLIILDSVLESRPIVPEN